MRFGNPEKYCQNLVAFCIFFGDSKYLSQKGVRWDVWVLIPNLRSSAVTSSAPGALPSDIWRKAACGSFGAGAEPKTTPMEKKWMLPQTWGGTCWATHSSSTFLGLTSPARTEKPRERRALKVEKTSKTSPWSATSWILLACPSHHATSLSLSHAALLRFVCRQTLLVDHHSSSSTNPVSIGNVSSSIIKLSQLIFGSHHPRPLLCQLLSTHKPGNQARTKIKTKTKTRFQTQIQRSRTTFNPKIHTKISNKFWDQIQTEFISNSDQIRTTRNPCKTGFWARCRPISNQHSNQNPHHDDQHCMPNLDQHLGQNSNQHLNPT